MNNKIKLKVHSLTDSHIDSGAYALILTDENEERFIPVIIGMSEAQAIMLKIENVKPARPVTHDLFSSLFEACKIELIEASICKWEDGVFYAELTLKQEGVEGEIHIDSRTSDAVAIAMRCGCDIFIDEDIFNSYSVIFEYMDDSDETNSNEDYLSNLLFGMTSDDEEDDEDSDGEEDDDDEIDEDEEEDIENDDEYKESLLDRARDYEASIAATFDDNAIKYSVLADCSDSDLEKLIENAIAQERYEYAKIYRDELLRREQERADTDDDNNKQ